MDLRPLIGAHSVDGPVAAADLVDVPDTTEALSEALGGVTLDGGLMRFHDVASAAIWTVAGAFPAFAARVTCFAADWLGRQFALDEGRGSAHGRPLVLLLEPGIGQALEIPTTLAEFVEAELVRESEAALASSFYEEWRQTTLDTVPLRPDECVGYRVPLFLGGADDVANLERTDMAVYWGLTGQMITQVRP